MATPTTLAECREAYAVDVAPTLRDVSMLVLLNRAFMHGAMAAVRLQQSGRPLEDLYAECLQFGRAVGAPAERAKS
jgi:hypothetical protein